MRTGKNFTRLVRNSGYLAQGMGERAVAGCIGRRRDWFGNFLGKVVGVVMLVGLGASGWGQLSITGTGSGNTYTQNFNTFAGTAVTVPTNWAWSWTDFTPGGFYNRTGTYSNTNSTYALRESASPGTDIAFGGKVDGTARTLIFSIVNNTGSAITGFVLGWNIEQYSIGGTTATPVSFSYRLNSGAYGQTSATGSGLAAVAASTGTAANLASITTTARAISISGISLANNGTADFRFTIGDGTANNAHMGIDDFDLYATGAAAVPKYWDISTASGTGGSATWGSTFNTLQAGTAALTTAGSTDDVIFEGTAGTVTLGASQTVKSATVNVGSYIFASSANATLTSTNGIALGGNIISLAPATSTKLTIPSVISGTAGITQNGAGTTVLSGTNTYSGSTTVTQGTLSVGADLNLGADPGSATPGKITMNGGTLAATASFTIGPDRGIALTTSTTSAIDVATSTHTLIYSGILAGSGVLRKTGAGVLNLQNSNNSNGKIIIEGGFISASGQGRFCGNPGSYTADQITLNGGGIKTESTSSINFDNNRGITLGTSGGSFDVTDADANITLTTASIAGTLGGALTKIGAGTLIFATPATYNGATTITAGTLRLGVANALPNTNITLGGGTFSTGSASGFSDAVGTLGLTSNSTVALGTGVHTLTFTGTAPTWTVGQTLTIMGWIGTAGGNGTAGRIFVPNSTYLTSTQLSQVTFNLFTAGAAIIANGGNWELVPALAAPEINIRQASTDIASGGTHTFASTAIGSTTDVIFRIQNTGGANLTFTTPLTASGDYNIIAPLASSPVAGPSGFTEFTVRFTPTALGTRSGSVTITNNDAEEGSYVVNFTGTGTPCATSTITTDAGYVYTQNIAYVTFQSIPVPASAGQSVGVHNVIITDAACADGLPTILNAITFSYTGTASTIRSAALFTTANSKIADVTTVNANSLVFSGLSITANSGSTAQAILRVTFNTAVSDNEKLVFTVGSATAAGSSTSSLFSSFAAVSDNNIGSDNNRIEVTASRLAFVQGPSAATNGQAMSPAVTVQAEDGNSNRDLDNSASITLTCSTPTAITSGAGPIVASNGLATFSSLIHGTNGTFTLIAEASGLTSTAVSSSYVISSVVSGTYRTVSGGTWPSSGTATWERFLAGAWGTSSAPSAGSTSLLIIRHAITSNASFAASAPGTYMTIESGGTFNAGHNCTFAAITIKSGGVLSVNIPGVSVDATGTITAELGGKVILNSGTLDNADGIWDGTEDFKDGSTVELQNWDWDNSGSGAYRLVDNPSQISANAAGYLFGNLFFNAAPTENFTFINSIPASGTLKLTQNDLRINNTSSFAVQLVNTDQDVEISGSVLVEGGEFRFAAVSAVEVAHTVNGNIQMSAGTINLNPTSGTSNGCMVNLKGDLNLSAGTFTTADLTSTGLNFAGNTIQNIDVANLVSMSGIKMVILNGASTQIIDQNLLIGNNCDITVQSGGTFNFNFDGFDNALNVSEIASSNTTAFTLQAGGTLKITSADANGAIRGSAASGNIQTDTRTLDVGGIYHYIGKANQITGDGLPAGVTPTFLSGKVIVEMDNNSLTLTPNASRGITGELNIKKGTLIETNSTAFFNGNGNLTMSDGLYQIATTNTGATQLPRLSGTYTLIGGSVELNGATTSSTVLQTLRGASREYFNLKISGSSSGGGYKNISSGIVIKNNLEISGTPIFDIENNGMTGDGGITMSGGRLRMRKLSTSLPELDGTATPYALTGGTVEFYGSGASSNQLIRGTDGNGDNISYVNIDVNATAANTETGTSFYNVSPSASFIVTGNLVVNSPAVFRLDEAESISGIGNVTLQSGSALLYGSPNGIKTSGTGTSDGNVRISGTRTFPTTASYGFVGNGNMVSGTGLPATVEGLYVYKTATTDQVTLTNAVTISDGGILTLNSGLLNTNNTQTLTLSTSATTSGGSTSSFVNGPLYKQMADGSGDIIMPVGKAATTEYQPVTLVDAAGTGTSTFLVEYFATGATDGTRGDDPLSPNLMGTWENRYWQIDKSPGDIGLRVGLPYTNANSEPWRPGGPGGGRKVAVVRFDGADWVFTKNFGAFNDRPPALREAVRYDTISTVYTGIINTFSPFTFGFGGSNVLPVKLISFDAKAMGNEALLQWQISDGATLSHFELEQSLLGVTFENIGNVPANSNNQYSYRHGKLGPGNYFFRLKIIDKNGSWQYSPIKQVTIGKEETYIIAWRHAGLGHHKGQLVVNSSRAQQMHAVVFDIAGRRLKTYQFPLLAGVNTLVLPLSYLPTGNYRIQVVTQDGKVNVLPLLK